MILRKNHPFDRFWWRLKAPWKNGEAHTVLRTVQGELSDPSRWSLACVPPKPVRGSLLEEACGQTTWYVGSGVVLSLRYVPMLCCMVVSGCGTLHRGGSTEYGSSMHAESDMHRSPEILPTYLQAKRALLSSGFQHA